MSDHGDVYKLIDKIAELNPENGEIGPGMLRQIVEEASRIRKRIKESYERI